jgi:hypothetical protein
MLSTRELISRLTPTALAGVIASLDLFGPSDQATKETLICLRDVLVANVGEEEADSFSTRREIGRAHV